MKPIKVSAVLFSLFFGANALWAEGIFPEVRAVPWNGHKAAMSLTFDDGDPSQLDLAVPELNRRHMHGTFFLIANRITRKDDWRKILESGHEIGNHTLDDPHPAGLTPGRVEAQVVGAKNVLQKEFGIRIYSFAYPYAEVTPEMRKWAGQNHLLARGGEGPVYDLKSDGDPDWMDLPSRATMAGTPFSTYRDWIKKDYKDGGWLVWTIHGLEGTARGWEPIPQKTFERILDAIHSRDIWAGTFLEVGAYFRAQKIFEKGRTQASGPQETWTWRVPDLFPPDVVLKVKADEKGMKDGKDFEIRQDNVKISPDEKGFYPIHFDKGRLTLRLLTKK